MDENIDGILELYGELFVDKLKAALRLKYPYSPGYDGVRQTTGSATKRAGVHYGYNQSLYDSITYNYHPSTQEVEVLMNEYWQWVNDGRRPGSYVPIRPLELWAQKRLGLEGREAKSAAFGISKNIQKFGIAPTYFYDTAIEALDKQINTEMFDEVGTSVEDFIEHLVEDIIPFNNEIII